MSLPVETDSASLPLGKFVKVASSLPQQFILLGHRELMKTFGRLLNRFTAFVSECPVTVRIQGVSMRVLVTPTEVVNHTINIRQLRDATVETGMFAQQQCKFCARLTRQDGVVLPYFPIESGISPGGREARFRPTLCNRRLP